MTDYQRAPDDLESRLIYPEVIADEVPEVVLVEATVDDGHHLKDDVADAADAVADKAGDAAHALSDAATHAASAVKEAAPSGAQLKRGVDRVGELAQQSPIGLVLTGACVGFLAGMLLPTTTVDEKIGPYAEQVVDRAREAGHTAVEQGKHAMQEAAPAPAPAVGAALRS